VHVQSIIIQENELGQLLFLQMLPILLMGTVSVSMEMHVVIVICKASRLGNIFLQHTQQRNAERSSDRSYITQLASGRFFGGLK